MKVVRDILAVQSYMNLLGGTNRLDFDQGAAAAHHIGTAGENGDGQTGRSAGDERPKKGDGAEEKTGANRHGELLDFSDYVRRKRWRGKWRRSNTARFATISRSLRSGKTAILGQIQIEKLG